MNRSLVMRKCNLHLSLIPIIVAPVSALAADPSQHIPSMPPTAIAAEVSADDLRSAVQDENVRKFYAESGWRACWSPAAEQELLSALDRRKAHGLDLVDFGPRPSASDSALTHELKLTRLALNYASALAQGVVDPTDLHSIYTLPRRSVALPAGLAQALAANRIGDWLESLAPTTEEYSRLSAAYLDYSRKALEDARKPLPDSGLIHVGDRDPRVPAILGQLADNDYLSAETLPATTQVGYSESVTYTIAMKDAVKRLQQDYSIAADGIVGPDTIGILNLRAHDRARALAVAMERRRWMPRSRPATRIDVNIAAARL